MGQKMTGEGAWSLEDAATGAPACRTWLTWLMKNVECVIPVVNEVDGLPSRDSKSEESTCAGAAGIDRLDSDLHVGGRGLDDVAVASVNRENVAIGRDGQAERLVQSATLRYRRASSCAVHAGHSIRDRSNPAPQ